MPWQERGRNTYELRWMHDGIALAVCMMLGDGANRQDVYDMAHKTGWRHGWSTLVDADSVTVGILYGDIEALRVQLEVATNCKAS